MYKNDIWSSFDLQYGKSSRLSGYGSRLPIPWSWVRIPYCIYFFSKVINFLGSVSAAARRGTWAKFCVGAKHQFFLPRVNRPQRFQKSCWKFPKMIIGCPRLPEIRNLRIWITRPQSTNPKYLNETNNARY
jgi:hypothetical protein